MPCGASGIYIISNRKAIYRISARKYIERAEASISTPFLNIPQPGGSNSSRLFTASRRLQFVLHCSGQITPLGVLDWLPVSARHMGSDIRFYLTAVGNAVPGVPSAAMRKQCTRNPYRLPPSAVGLAGTAFLTMFLYLTAFGSSFSSIDSRFPQCYNRFR